jgi:hypothetical protein
MREGYRDEHEGSCGGEGPERVFTFELEATARLEASVSGFDTVLYLRQSCDPQTELECNDDVNNPQDMGSAFSAELEAGRYFLFLDSFEDPEGYVLVLDFEAGCEDECFLGRSSCRDGGLRACTSSPEGCAVWGPVEQCAETEVCERGACQPLCEDECENPGGRVCSSEGGYRLCGLSPEGCASLSPVFECPGEDVCVEDGVCEPVVVSRAAPASDGCACSVGTSQPTSPWHLLWALIFFRRASRGGRRRQ